MQQTKDTRQLTWLLAWAVVFCDIGTSVYYVPSILYGHVKDATPFFVLLTSGGFFLRTSRRLFRGLVGLLRSGKYQSAESGYALSAAPHDTLGHGRRDVYDD